MRSCVNLGAAFLMVAIAGCTSGPKKIDQYSTDEVLNLSRQWARAAMDGQNFAEEAQCEPENATLPLAELVANVKNLEDLQPEIEFHGSYYHVKFHDQLSLGSDVLEPPLELLFFTQQSFEAVLGDGELDETDQNWCVVANID